MRLLFFHGFLSDWTFARWDQNLLLFRLALVIPCRCGTRRRELVALPKLKAIIMCLDKAHLCFLPLLESTALDNQDRLQSSRTCCHQCMHTHSLSLTHTHTFSLFQRTMHHLVGGRPPGRATAGPVVNDELFGLLFCHPRSHTFEVIGYVVGPFVSNARHTFIHVMCYCEGNHISGKPNRANFQNRSKTPSSVTRTRRLHSGFFLPPGFGSYLISPATLGHSGH